MRAALFVFMFLLLGLSPSLAASPATTLLPAAKPAAPANGAAPATPAPAIIPGSPLATLAGATAAPPATEGAEAAPFGSDQLGFVLSGAVGDEAVHAFNSFLAAVRTSTNLTPVVAWLGSFRTDHVRFAELRAILLTLLAVVLPAAFVDAGIRLAMRRPMRQCARLALPRANEYLPDAETEPAPEPDPEPAPSPGAVTGSATIAQAEAEARLEPPPKPEAPRRYVSFRAWMRRFAFALIKLFFALLPLAGFVITVQICISTGLVPKHVAVLALTTTANAYLCCRLAQEAGRFLFSPAAPELRLFTLSTTRAAALMRWLLVLLGTIFISWTFISCALLLDLSHEGMAVLLRMVVLIIHLEMAWGIWRSRRVVGRWITGDPKATGAVAWLRQRFGQWWQYFALFYVLALWVAWAGGVQNAFFVLLRAILVVIASIIIGHVAWGASYSLLDRIFADPTKSRFPNLITRARNYSPLIGFLFRAIIVIAAFLFILQGWGVDALYWLNHNLISKALISAISSVLITTGFALFLWETCNFALHTRVDNLTSSGRRRQATRLRTLAPILRAAAGTFIFAIAFVVCLSDIGVNTTGLLAVSSIAGIAVGFGSQRLVQDIITGLFMLLEDAIQVGNSVTLGGMSGTVERLSVRTIRLRGSDGSVNIIPFSSVTIVTNSTRDFNFAEISITVGYHEDIDRVCAVLADLGRAMRAESVWGAMMRDDLQIFGLDKFGERGIVVTGQIRTGPGQNSAVRREFYRRVQMRFAEEGIIIPLGQQQVFKLEMAPLPAPEPAPSPEQKPS